MQDLTEDDLVRILIEPKNAIIKQYQKLFALDEIDLSFKTDALREIARVAIERKIGARGLRSILEKTLSSVIFRASDNLPKKIQITKKMVK